MTLPEAVLGLQEAGLEERAGDDVEEPPSNRSECKYVYISLIRTLGSLSLRPVTHDQVVDGPFHRVS